MYACVYIYMHVYTYMFMVKSIAFKPQIKSVGVSLAQGERICLPI